MFKVVMVYVGHNTQDKLRYLDLGASKYVTCDMSKMLGVGTSLVRSTCNQTHNVEGEGNVIFSYNGSMKCIILVLYIPRLTKNLLSVGNYTDKGCLVTFGPSD
jgi:hypothetical protein